MSQFRTEHDSMGDIHVPEDALYQAQTQRAVNNFQFSRRRFPTPIIHALIDIKAHAARVNQQLNHLDAQRASAIIHGAKQAHKLDMLRQFPIDLFQTGSGTSTNMNVNEVLATLAGKHCQLAIHPNDHVNMGQSSNDTVPSAIQIACGRLMHQQLLPALAALSDKLNPLIERYQQQVKTGRTHLMDAMPITLSQEIATWQAQLDSAAHRLQQAVDGLYSLPLGGTAVGTGVNTDSDFAPQVCHGLSRQDNLPWQAKPNPGEYMAAQEHHLFLAGALKTLAVALIKIANDLRWMNSGPNAGLQEIQLQALQPGSSIMPGKVNPVIPEAVAMIGAEVIGHEASITMAAQSGNFQLNVMLPLIGDKLLESIELLSNACIQLSKKVFSNLTVNSGHMDELLTINPILATGLNEEIGYEKAAKIAKRANKEKKSVEQIAAEECPLSQDRIAELLNPLHLARPHHKK